MFAIVIISFCIAAFEFSPKNSDSFERSILPPAVKKYITFISFAFKTGEDAVPVEIWLISSVKSFGRFNKSLM